MTPVVLDTSALLALRDDEPGADRVADLLAEAASGRRLVLACFITEMELWYRVWKDEGEPAGRAAHAACRALPIQWVHESPALLARAVAVKAQHPLSLADAWIAATALEADAVLLHKDPEYERLPGLKEERLPYR
jgi:predicted nucleic acid-binding protein